MVAGALDDRDRPGIAHGEAFTRHAAEIALAGDRAIHHRVADDDGGLGRQLHGFLGRVDDDAPARKPLADIIVAVAFEFERHAARQEGAEALARRALELDVDRLVAQAGVAVRLGDFARKHGAGGAIRIADRHV